MTLALLLAPDPGYLPPPEVPAAVYSVEVGQVAYSVTVTSYERTVEVHAAGPDRSVEA